MSGSKKTKKIRRLIIDDCRIMSFPGGWTVHAAVNSDAIEFLKEFAWDEVWFDYDMGKVFGKLETEYESTILPTVDWILEQAVVEGKPPQIGMCVLHTANPVGRKQLQTALERFYPIRHVDAATYTVAINSVG